MIAPVFRNRHVTRDRHCDSLESILDFSNGVLEYEAGPTLCPHIGTWDVSAPETIP